MLSFIIEYFSAIEVVAKPTKTARKTSWSISDFSNGLMMFVGNIPISVSLIETEVEAPFAIVAFPASVIALISDGSPIGKSL